jgi:quinol monooxygenase YgiN
MSGKVTLFVRFVVEPGRLDEFRAANKAIRDSIEANEPGTLLYETYLSADGTRAANVEVFEDSAALVAHMANVAPLIPALDAASRLVQLEVLGSPTPEGRAAIESLATGWLPLLGAIAR